MESLIIYEVSEPAAVAEVRQQLLIKGYFTQWMTTDANKKVTKYNLPSNAVWKKDVELATAYTDFHNVINQLNFQRNPKLIINSCIVVSAIPWTGLPVPE